MSDDRFKQKIGTFAIRIASGKLFLPDDVASKVENFYPTEEGTLRAVEGPLPYLPDPISGGAPAGALTADITTPRYGTMHGVFHALVGRNGERDILLCQTGSQIWEFAGWDKGWSLLIGDSSAPSGPGAANDSFENNFVPQFPTQFESTSTGIIIVPQEGRAYFYDGTYVAPLGYSEAPSAPTGLGPESRFKSPSFDGEQEAQFGGVNWLLGGYFVGMGINDGDYAYDSLAGRESGMIRSFKNGRLGTVRNPITWLSSYQKASTADPDLLTNKIDSTKSNAVVGGWLEAGSWRAATQWIDRWGNLSPLSGRSDEVTFSYQPSTYWDFTYKGPVGDPAGISIIANAEDVKKQIAWCGIDPGPERTIGRVLYRTKDVLHAGTADLFRLPQDATESAIAFATLPDNISSVYPDNIPDGWLVRRATEIVPVPQFKLCRVAFGRLWIANTSSAPGLVRPSLPGRWGTFPANQELFPDPSGDEITGLWRSAVGLLAFTTKSTFLILPNDGGDGFRSLTLSSEVGCTAPSSLATLKDGTVLWMGYDGFYAFAPTEDYARGVQKVSIDIELFVRRVTHARRKQATAAVDTATNEYRCWVSLDGSRTNNFCFIYDGQGWRSRTDIKATAVCTTKDHRNYFIVAGESNARPGVWLLDHAQGRYLPAEVTSREAILETAWLSTPASQERRTAYVLYLWLRESSNSTVIIEVMRDWRNTIVETTSAKRFAGDDIPEFWGTTALGDGKSWQKKRPYWTRAAIYVPSAEVFKFRIRGAGQWEFVGIQLDEADRGAGGARIPP